MATPSSVKSQSSALVAFAQHIKDRLADTLELTQYQPLYVDPRDGSTVYNRSDVSSRPRQGTD